MSRLTSADARRLIAGLDGPNLPAAQERLSLSAIYLAAALIEVEGEADELRAALIVSESRRQTAHESGFSAGVEALRDQIIAYLLDPAMREAFVAQGSRVIPVLAQVLRGFHPGYVKSGASKVKP